jgi:hypothetical protein
MQIPTDDLRFFVQGGNNYRQLIGQTADRFNGQAFVTEFAGPSSNFSFTDPLLVELAQKHRYLTRLNTVISPEEMTVDPVFGYDGNRADVSNIRDLSDYDKDLYTCDRQSNFDPAAAENGNEGGAIINLPFIGNGGGNDNSAVNGGDGDTSSSSSSGFRTGIIVGILVATVAGAFVAIGAGIYFIRRSGK